jgi:hypothetical protein
MAFDALKAEINLLWAQIADRPADQEELEAMLREKIGELKAFGLPLPQDLVDLEAALDAELTSEETELARKSAPEEE